VRYTLAGIVIACSASSVSFGQSSDSILLNAKETIHNCDVTMWNGPACKALLSAFIASNRPANTTSDGHRVTHNTREEKNDSTGSKADRSKLLALPTSSSTESKRLAIRQDSLDAYYYAFGQSASAAGNAKGASLSVTDNFYSIAASTGAISHAESITGTAFVSYLLTPQPQRIWYDQSTGSESEWAAALWAYGNGNYDEPKKKFGDYSVARAGADLQLHWIAPYRPSESWLSDVFFSARPYVQTDFYGKGAGEGIVFSASPVVKSVNLGESKRDNQYLNWFWTFRIGENPVVINAPGQTLYSSGFHNLVQEEARLYLFPLPGPADPASPNYWPAWIQDRISLIASEQVQFDLTEGNSSTYLTAALAYKLAGCLPGQDCNTGSSSVSLEYDTGKDPDTLSKINKLMGKLNFAF
jgi:hypothetical protein